MRNSNYSNHTAHVARRITDQKYWFYVAKSEICPKTIEQEITHSIPLEHPHHWK